MTERRRPLYRGRAGLSEREYAAHAGISRGAVQKCAGVGSAGFTRLEWQKLRERNEALDCRVYARAAAWIAGIDRWPERKWQELERQLGIEPKPAPAPATESAEQRMRADPLSNRRAMPSGWLGGRPRNWLQRG